MIVGHVGIALAAKGARPQVPLWLLVLAALVPDFVDLALGFAGWRPETSAMWSHSIPAVCAIAAMFAAGAWMVYRDGATAALVAGLVLSHVLVDYVTGQKPTWPGGPLIGLHLYSWPRRDFVLETAVIVGGWLLYRRSLGTASRRSPVVFALCAFLVAVQLACDLQQQLLPAAHQMVDPLWRRTVHITRRAVPAALAHLMTPAERRVRR